MTKDNGKLWPEKAGILEREGDFEGRLRKGGRGRYSPAGLLIGCGE